MGQTKCNGSEGNIEQSYYYKLWLLGKERLNREDVLCREFHSHFK